MIELDQCKLFKDLPAAQVKSLRSAARQLQFPAGQQIFQEGDPPDGLYVVRNGLIQIFGAVSSGQQEVYAQVGPGDVFGEMAVLDELPRSASAMAQVDSMVYFIPREALLDALRNVPDLLLLLVRAVTQRFREFNRQFLQTVVRAERMSLTGKFASSIVHDLKNPLTIINLAIESLSLASATPEMRQRAGERISTQVERITSLVNDILDYTRGSQTSQILTRTSYVAFLKTLLGEVGEELKLRSVAIQLDHESPEVAVALNAKRLRRVFYNLFGNAADVMPGGGTILLRVKVIDNRVVTEIEDTGPGIDPGHLERIFEPFFTHGKAHGTGLGLAICQRIVHDHQGTLTVRNRSGGGAIFTLSLPQAA